MMKNTFLNLTRTKKQVVAAALDFVFLPLAFFVALALHFDTANFAVFSNYGWLLPLVPVVAIPVFILNGFYLSITRYVNHEIFKTIVRSAAIAVFLLFSIGTVFASELLSIAPFAIFLAILVFYMVASRFMARGFFGDRRLQRTTRVAIYGAGDAGIQLAYALRPGIEYKPVLFVDDNPELHKMTIGGIKTHPASQLETLIEEHDIDVVMLAIPSLTRLEQRRILDVLTLLKVRVMVTPPIKSIIKGVSRVEDVREIQIEDLLSRDPVAPDESLLSVCIEGKSVAVSGAGGSIGSELCRQIVKLAPKRLIMIELSEYALYAIDQELRSFVAAHDLNVELIPFMGSVGDFEKCREIFEKFDVETVYHAAAYKHVPLVEQNPVEGIRNNVFGTLSIARAAVAAKVKCFVLVSTDKAVRPTNVMGSTKRMAELILQAFSRQHSSTRFCMVRFGNVLGSSGSVVPLFRRQLAAGGPLTLTHPEITRYFMTIPEAAQLVLQAGSMGTGGDVFVLDMGEPVKIADLAKRMVHLSGQEVRAPDTPHGRIEIKFVGLRPGEKLYEELLIGDNVTGTAHPLIMRAQEAEIAWPFLELMLKQLGEACDRFDHDAIRKQLQKIVSEYAPSSEIDDHLWRMKDRSQAAATDEARVEASA